MDTDENNANPKAAQTSDGGDAAPPNDPEKGPGEPAAPDADKPTDSAARAGVSARVEELSAMVRRLESFAAAEAKRVSGDLLPEVERRAKQNIWVSLLFALGLGLILGLWLNGGRRRG